MGPTIWEKLASIKTLKDEPATWVDSATVMQSGRLILTSKCLLFVLNDAQHAAIKIDLDTVNAIAHESVLVDHNIMSINYLQYDTVKFSVLDYEAWEKAIDGQRMQPHI